jgi:hypothetical protein
VELKLFQAFEHGIMGVGLTNRSRKFTLGLQTGGIFRSDPILHRGMQFRRNEIGKGRHFLNSVREMTDSQSYNSP